MNTDGLFRALGSCIGAGLEMIGGLPFDFKSGASGLKVDLWWRQGCTVNGLASEIWIGAADTLWKKIGEPADEADAKVAFFEALSQATLRVLDDLQREAGTAIVPIESGESLPPPKREYARSFSAECADGSAKGDVTVVIDSAIAQAIEAAQYGAVDTEQDSLVNLNRATAKMNEAEPMSPSTARILDIPLPASIRIAQTVMPIREVLRLTPGAVVELGKYSGEPVEIVVHGTVLARGDIVSVKGYYGVRITEIVARNERLAAIGTPRIPEGRTASVVSA